MAELQQFNLNFLGSKDFIYVEFTFPASEFAEYSYKIRDAFLRLRLQIIFIVIIYVSVGVVF